MAVLKIPRTYVAKPSTLAPEWHLFDASKQPLGRLASEIARLLQGKHRPYYTTTLMTGDFVVVTNAARAMFTGRNKLQQREFHFHSGYPGGLRTFTLEQMLARRPGQVVKIAVEGMLPKTTLGRQMLKRLKVYPTRVHPHHAQIAGYGTPEARALEASRAAGTREA